MVVSQRNLQVVFVGLILPPCFLSLLLLKCEHLVIGLEFLEGLVALSGVLVLEDAPHPGESLSLLGIGFLFLAFAVLVEPLLAHLLVSPVLLVLSVDHHSLVVHCKK